VVVVKEGVDSTIRVLMRRDMVLRAVVVVIVAVAFAVVVVVVGRVVTHPFRGCGDACAS
jgi:hypothetical protein